MTAVTNVSPIIKVIGPIPETTDLGIPFRGTPSPVGVPDPAVEELLPTHGYVEEEFFLSGTVMGQPYRTSLLVRRPADSSAFSGLVVLEPVHLQGALGLWQACHPSILSGGHAWVALGSQRGALEGLLKLINPARYADLHIPACSESDDMFAELQRWSESTSDTVPAGLFQPDPVSNAILAQVGTLLKTGASDALLPGFVVEHLVMGGASQTGGVTLNFIEAANANARLPDGNPVYDGFLPLAATGRKPVSGGDAAVIHAFAEGDLVLFGAISQNGSVAARSDSDEPDDRYRCYQITASAHLPTRGLREAKEIPLLGVSLKPDERFIQFPSAPFYHAAFIHLVNWVTKDRVPPHADPIEIAQGAIVTDEWGNAKGGVRSPYVDVPVARYLPARYLRSLIGVELPFSLERLQQLYASRESYLTRFNESMDKAVSEGWLTLMDGERLKSEEVEAAQL